MFYFTSRVGLAARDSIADPTMSRLRGSPRSRNGWLAAMTLSASRTSPAAPSSPVFTVAWLIAAGD